MRSRPAGVAIVLVLTLLVPVAVHAQWLNYKTPGIPRLPNGKANLSAPAPRTAEGKPDLNGVWSGAGPMYRYNIAQDLQAGDVQPWAEALFRQRVRESRKDSPLSKCMPVSLPYHQFFNLTRLVQTPALMIVLHESPNSPNRTVFLDGRDLPKDPNPTYMGYSVGTWEGDTLVVVTSGFNDKGWLDSAGHPQTESLKITERYRRRDFGHMDWDITIDDPKAFTKSFTIKTQRTLQADTELLEDVCENERSRARFVVDTSVTITSAVAKSYAGTYELAPGREVVITAEEDLLFVRGLNEPRLPLIPTSQTQFMSTATAAGFEFVKDARGNVTHLIVRGSVAETKAVRKSP